ncbi:Amidohydrolase [Posidoniimonas polymericola]|uniref:Amidohydrolase n=1 Tax=Posidoniimonas polymericola TaxID=2528002 RepID=A0A5C5YRZ4_9BACT|nr:amidohydrolase family protein [Posidoniimonas polymericola]TWT77638.1 Amidohydrolase [Posidoniimonas polymericola]
MHRSHSARWRLHSLVCLLAALGAGGTDAAETDPRADALAPDVWRAEHRLIDLHMHVDALPERFRRAVGVMDAAGLGVAVELGSGTVTPTDSGPSAYEQNLAAQQQGAPGRFMHYMLLDYGDWDSPDWSAQAVKQIERGRELGAAGLKEFKRLGLTLRDGAGRLIKIDDPKLDPVWRRCGELGMPISIHVGDPQAFWEPLDESNERWAELKDHPNWWFGDPAKHPPREELLEALDRVIARHPETTFLGVHFANNPEDIDWVDRALDRRPNMRADIAARVPEIGRGDPERLRNQFVKHQDRILFGTDFQVGDRLILGSAGDDERPTDHEALVFYRKFYRFFETADRDWVHMTPIQGDWTISSIDLPPAVARRVYFDNARQMLAQSYPAPTLRAARIEDDFTPDGRLDEAAWDRAEPQRIEYGLQDAATHPGLSTAVRALWSDAYLYLAFEAPYDELTTRDNPAPGERLGLWKEDVVEFFLARGPGDAAHYSELEWAPNGEYLDLILKGGESDFDWSAGNESKVVIDRAQKIWRVEARVPLAKLADQKPTAGDRWPANLYRNNAASSDFLAWRPTLTRTAHTPARFGWLEFAE